MSDKFDKMPMAPFVDTASRGSQTDETTRGDANYRPYTYPGSIHTPVKGDNQAATATIPAKKRPIPTPSRIAPLAIIPETVGKGHKARRITPNTNRLVGNIPPQLSDTEFDISGIAFGPIPIPSNRLLGLQ